MIAFVMATTQLCGRKVLLKAGRVREEHRGRGVYGRLIAFQVEQMKLKFPNLETEEFFTNNVNVSLHKLYASSQYRNFCTRSFLNYKAIGWRSSSLSSTHGFVIRDIGVDGIADILRDEDKRTGLFPTRIYVIWEMYDPLLSELTYVRQMNPDVLATSKESAGNEITAVSTCCSYRAMEGRMYVIQFHFAENTTTSTAKTIVSALTYNHLMKLKELSAVDILALASDSSFAGAVTEAAQELGLKKIEQFATCLIGFNRNI